MTTAYYEIESGADQHSAVRAAIKRSATLLDESHRRGGPWHFIFEANTRAARRVARAHLHNALMPEREFAVWQDQNFLSEAI